jgi:hypothetical protein
MAFEARVADTRVPLLDKGTLNKQSPGQSTRFSASLSRFQVVAYPTAGEASIRQVGSPDAHRLDPVDEDHLVRSIRRSRSAIRRFCVHNGLGYMATLTFRNPPSLERSVQKAIELFLKRLRYAGVADSYAWVLERGEARGRLHVHFACRWWGELGAVEVCEKCASAGLRAVRLDIPPPGSFCIGCMWGQGFVGAPSECIGDPRGVAIYVSKYAAKALGFKEGAVNRYHVPRGYQPPVERFGSYTFEMAVERLASSVDLSCAGVTVLHELLGEEWHGPPLWSFRWSV